MPGVKHSPAPPEKSRTSGSQLGLLLLPLLLAHQLWCVVRSPVPPPLQQKPLDQQCFLHQYLFFSVLFIFLQQNDLHWEMRDFRRRPGIPTCSQVQPALVIHLCMFLVLLRIACLILC